MKRSIFFLLTVLAISLSLPAWASKEGMLAFSNLSMKSSGIESSGPVEISGVQSSSGIVMLRIKAFDTEISLSSHQLLQVRGLIVNGIQLSFEHGYGETGGRTLYIVLTQGLTSGRERAATIEINERGSVRITQEAF